MKLAPIAFFAFKRPDHTLRALTALSQCDLASESTLYVFCDGERTPDDHEQVEKVRAVVGSRKWCGVVHPVVREKNFGLAESVISGVTSVVRSHGRVVVLEDDLLVSPFFLRYMNDALDLYEDEGRVMQVSGYMFDINYRADTDAAFLPFTTSWGWGTWKRAWEMFDPSMEGYGLLKREKGLRKRFNLDGAYDFFGMLKLQKEGKVDSWAIRWYLNVFLSNGLVLYPEKTLVENIGWDGSGVHCGDSGVKKKIDSDFKVYAYPADIVTSNAYEVIKYHIGKRNGVAEKARKAFNVIFGTNIR